MASAPRDSLSPSTAPNLPLEGGVMHLTKVGESPKSGADRPALLNESDTATLSFSCGDDALNFARHCAKNSRRWAARQCKGAVERYREGEIRLVVRFDVPGGDAKQHDLVFAALPTGDFKLDWGARARDSEVIEGDSPGEAGHRNDGRVCLVSELVEGPEESIPSFVWLEGAKERPNLNGEVFASPGDIVVHIGGGIPERKLGQFGVGNSIELRDSEAQLIEGRSDIVEGIGGVVEALVGDSAVQFELVDFRDAVGIHFDENLAWCLLKKEAQPFIKVHDVFATATEF
jgi:hypothetical protein